MHTYGKSRTRGATQTGPLKIYFVTTYRLRPAKVYVCASASYVHRVKMKNFLTPFRESFPLQTTFFPLYCKHLLYGLFSFYFYGDIFATHKNEREENCIHRYICFIRIMYLCPRWFKLLHTFWATKRASGSGNFYLSYISWLRLGRSHKARKSLMMPFFVKYILYFCTIRSCIYYCC